VDESLPQELAGWNSRLIVRRLQARHALTGHLPHQKQRHEYFCFDIRFSMYGGFAGNLPDANLRVAVGC
jgi:hypothetical protein